MTQPITGVSPASLQETTVMTVWPGITRFWLGRLFGRLYENKTGFYVFTLGNLAALLTAPVGAMMYLLGVAPWVATRYRLTNRRIIVERGWSAAEEKSVDLDRFDSIEIVRRPGQKWFHHGDLVFKLGQNETFRLEAVLRPQAFREVLLKANKSHVSVKQALVRQGLAV
jgi:uncharacterized membrane protein YdbT with pleckstrin-like domain